MKELSRQDILKYFEQINTRLAKENKYGEVLIAGGAALTLVFNARQSTYDIDAIFRPKEDMRAIIKSIAQEYDINEDWLNDGVKGFITDNMKGSTYLEYSNLTVSSLDAECLLAMKLTSARSLSKDMEDSIFLMSILKIKSEQELFTLIEKYTHPNQQTMQAKYFTMEAFERYSITQEKQQNRTLPTNNSPGTSKKSIHEVLAQAKEKSDVLNANRPIKPKNKTKEIQR